MKKSNFIHHRNGCVFYEPSCFCKTSEWKEKTEFHKIMSQTFHPAEEGNFAPIKSRIDEMETKEVAFKNSEIPADFGNKDAIKNL